MKNKRRVSIPGKFRLGRLPATLLFALAIAGSVYAQEGATIRGTVSDEHGGKIAGATVLLLSRSGIQISTTATNQSGTYQFSNLSRGVYFIEARTEGFSVFTSDDTDVSAGDDKSIDVVLKLASINASVVVTATGTAQRLEEVAKVVSTLESDEIEARHELTLAEAFRGTPGVRVQQQGSAGSLTSVRLRGQRNFDTSVLLDGLRVRDAGDINGSAFSIIPDLVPVSVNRVEILRGSGSSLHGTHAIGGVINIIPESGVPGIHVAAGFEGGNLATYRERLQISGGRDRVSFNVGVHRLDLRRGIDGDDQYGNSAFAGRLQFNPSSTSTVSGVFYGTISNARVNDSPFALPAAFGTSDSFPKALAGVNFQPDFNNPDQGRRNRLLLGAVKWSQDIGERVSYGVSYQRISSNRRNYNGPSVDPRFATFVPFGDFEFLNINRGTIDTFDTRLNLRFANSNIATFGFEFERESFFQRSEPSFNFFNSTTDRQRTFAFFAQDQLSFLDDRLRVSLGVRGQAYRLEAADRPGNLSTRETEKSLTGDGAISYFIRSSGTKLRAHVGNGFRAPSLFERFGEGTLAGTGPVRFGDPTLRAEQSISADGGVDQRLAGERLLVGLTYFYTRQQRVVAFTGFTVDPLGLGRFGGFVNRPGGLSRGVETSVDSVPWRGAELRASYTFTNSDRSVPSQGLRPEYVIPKHLVGVLWTQRYRAFLFSVDLNRTGSYVAPIFENSFPFRMAELRFAGYTKADVFGSYEWRRSEQVSLTLFGGIENVFHQKYFENGFLAPGTVGRLGMQVRF